ncbi:MAG TPA: ribonuclease HII [Gemmatimonadales bacterium]|nr:ribonuclease HII [Gemmatimonadales bacterium]
MPPVPTFAREAAVWADGRLLIGVDEVGRGPLAGPVVAAAVVFPAGTRALRGLRDSKVLPAAKRERLAQRVRARALALGLGAASAREIDRCNIRVATARAMRRAVRRLLADAIRRGSLVDCSRVTVSSDRLPDSLCLLLDGLPLPEIGLPHDALVDGDALCQSVAAAGVVAKTVRDELMRRLAQRHPGYGWATNAGYGTPEHQAALQRLGPTRHHRATFAPVAQLGFSFGTP